MNKIKTILKDKKNIAIIIGIIILIILSLIYCINSNNDAIKFKKEYESLNGTTREKDGKTIRSINISKNNPMIYSTADEVVKMINDKQTFLVYFGFEDCPWCRSVITNLIKAANDANLDKIYYVNIKEIRDNIELIDGKPQTVEKGSKGYYKLLKLLDNVLEDYNIEDNDGNKVSTGEKRIYAPNVIAIVNGKAKKLTEGISQKQTDGYMKLTKSMNKESYDDFKCVINCLLETQKTCSKESKC
jgi:thiol-disulfide isomerase/thioredoxin